MRKTVLVLFVVANYFQGPWWRGGLWRRFIITLLIFFPIALGKDGLEVAAVTQLTELIPSMVPGVVLLARPACHRPIQYAKQVWGPGSGRLLLREAEAAFAGFGLSRRR